MNSKQLVAVDTPQGGFYNKMAHSLDTNIQQFQQYRNKFQGRYFPIAVPQ